VDQLYAYEQCSLQGKGVQFDVCGTSTVAQSCLRCVENVTVVLRFEFLVLEHIGPVAYQNLLVQIVSALEYTWYLYISTGSARSTMLDVPVLANLHCRFIKKCPNNDATSTPYYRVGFYRQSEVQEQHRCICWTHVQYEYQLAREYYR
jgi:hypothetical protein